MAKITLTEDVAKEYELVGDPASDRYYAGSNFGYITLSKLSVSTAANLVMSGCTLLKKKESATATNVETESKKK